jgi:hypothetical protein
VSFGEQTRAAMRTSKPQRRKRCIMSTLPCSSCRGLNIKLRQQELKIIKERTCGCLPFQVSPWSQRFVGRAGSHCRWTRNLPSSRWH